TERLVNLCKKVGARTYLAGAGGRDYMDLKLFDKAGIQVIFQEYRHPVYPQFGGTFVPNLSAVDFIFYCGSEIAEEKW
ncbi:MAG: WbqC family protein, partial [Elusimicrobia bacterium]|nr:WbqC family protein [Elusimicrobiota bacterium]